MRAKDLTYTNPMTNTEFLVTGIPWVKTNPSWLEIITTHNASPEDHWKVIKSGSVERSLFRGAYRPMYYGGIVFESKQTRRGFRAFSRCVSREMREELTTEKARWYLDKLQADGQTPLPELVAARMSEIENADLNTSKKTQERGQVLSAWLMLAPDNDDSFIYFDNETPSVPARTFSFKQKEPIA